MSTQHSHSFQTPRDQSPLGERAHPQTVPLLVCAGCRAVSHGRGRVCACRALSALPHSQHTVEGERENYAVQGRKD